MIAELRRDEGVERKPYTDSVGKLTIGVGRNLTDVGLSDDEIDYLLHNDLKRVDADLDAHAAWWRTLDPVRQRVLRNLCFNMGWPRLAGFKNALGAMKAGKYATAANEMLDSTWARQVGARAQRLAAMMRTGRAP
jgi:lysozyme